MARTRLLLPVAVACIMGSVLIPSAAQAARLAPSAIPPARLTASLVDDLAPGPASSSPQDLTALKGKLFFTGPAGSDPQDVTAVGQVAYFTAYDPAHGRELWKLTVPPSPQLFLIGPLTSVTAGSSGTFTVTLEPAPGARQPMGSVTFYKDDARLGTSPLVRQTSGGPTASLTIAAPSGAHEVVAVYSGDGNYLPATSNTTTLTGN